MTGLALLKALGERGTTVKHLERILESQNPAVLEELSATIARLAKVDEEAIARLGVIDPETPAVRLRNVLRHADWKRHEPTRAQMLLACGNVEFVDEALKSVTSGPMGLWKRAAVCLRFGLGGQPPVDDLDKIALAVGQEGVAGWLERRESAYSFARMLSNYLVYTKVPERAATLFELPVEALNLSIRTTNMLRRVGIELIDDFRLQMTTRDSLLRAWSDVDNAEKYVDEVSHVLSGRGVWASGLTHD